MSELHQILSPYWKISNFPARPGVFIQPILELEEPQTIDQLLEPLIINRIQTERIAFKQNNEDMIYIPKDTYKAGQMLNFPAMRWAKGTVISSRPGYNPQIGEFTVIQVDFGNNESTNSQVN